VNLRSCTVLSFLACLCSGCMHEFRVDPAYAAPASTPMQTTVHTAAVGLSEPVVSPLNCTGNGVAEVVVSRSFRQRLTSISTLGIDDPMTIAWKCAKDSYSTAKPF
jgi:hypothetical protein